LALCLGLGAGALVAALGGFRQPAGEPVIHHGPGKPADAREEILPTQAGWKVIVATGQAEDSMEVPPAARVRVLWEKKGILGTCRNGETVEDEGMVFVRICPGTFRMGSSEQDRQAYDDEKPAHEVTLTSEYWIGQYEVTEEQYRKTAGSKRPVTNVTWSDAQKFCKERGWRLPTEAEWEYAARAGTTTTWSFGDDEKDLGDYAWFQENSGLAPHPVGTKKANRWGLYDMHGNVWEWVADWYAPYPPDPQTDPQGPEVSDSRVLRGGAFVGSPRVLRSALRFRIEPELRINNVGFRCARGPRRQP
jgi:formylglycine-generating enzyme required for sulfatase activity